MLVEFMKVPDGQTAAWVKLEQETWKPMHALRVKDGTIASWAMIAQQLPGDESNGPVVGTVTTFRGWPDPTRTDWPALLKRAHPGGNIDTLMQHTEATQRSCGQRFGRCWTRQIRLRRAANSRFATIQRANQ